MTSSSSSRSSPEPSDQSSSSTSSRSPSPIPQPSSHPKTKKNNASEPRNEGANPHWDFKPPEGTVLLDHSVDPGEFDWDTVKDDEDIELWLVRAPAELKSKHFDSLKLEAPSERTSRLGVLPRKHATYDIWSIPSSAALSSANEGLPAATAAGVEEVRGLSCLLPRKRNSGKLYIAPKPITRHIIISPQPPRATSPRPSSETGDGVPHDMYQNPPRPSYPPEVLKHRFLPNGARAGTSSASAMDVDAVIPALASGSSETKDAPGKDKEGKSPRKKQKRAKIA